MSRNTFFRLASTAWHYGWSMNNMPCWRRYLSVLQRLREVAQAAMTGRDQDTV
jgi:hypothetical protein